MVRFKKISRIYTNLAPAFIILLVLLKNCENTQELPDLNSISWIQKYEYQEGEIFPIKIGSKAGLKIPVSIENHQQYFLLDLICDRVIINDVPSKKLNFEPQRMSTYFLGNTEILLEEGYVHNVKILGQNIDILYCSILRNSNHSVDAEGVVGRNFFLNGRMTIDATNKIIAFSERQENKLSSFANTIPFKLNDATGKKRGLIKFYGEIENHRVLMTINPAYTFSQISPEFLKYNLSKTANRNYEVEKIKIGSKIFENINCKIKDDQLLLEADSDEPIHFTAGMDIISQVVLTIDFNEERILIEEVDKTTNSKSPYNTGGEL